MICCQLSYTHFVHLYHDVLMMISPHVLKLIDAGEMRKSEICDRRTPIITALANGFRIKQIPGRLPEGSLNLGGKASRMNFNQKKCMSGFIRKKSQQG